jgi:hypothetical protein
MKDKNIPAIPAANNPCPSPWNASGTPHDIPAFALIINGDMITKTIDTNRVLRFRIHIPITIALIRIPQKILDPMMVV